jgi:hypothetical protein
VLGGGTDHSTAAHLSGRPSISVPPPRSARRALREEHILRVRIEHLPERLAFREEHILRVRAEHAPERLASRERRVLQVRIERAPERPLSA